MNFNLSRFSSGIWIAISSIIVLIFFYFFYVEIYMKQQEKAVVSTRFRVLDQMGRNISKRYDILKQNAEDLSEKVALTNTSNANLPEKINSRKDINKKLKVTSVSALKDTENDKTWNANSKQLSFYIKINNSYELEAASRDAIMTVESSYENLLSGLERQDIFDGILLINNQHEVVHNTLNQEIILTKEAGDMASSGTKGETISKLDKEQEIRDYMKSKIGNIFSGEAIDIEISNRAYKAFLKPIEVNNETWFAIGLMNKSTFNAAIRSIAPSFVILLSLILIFIILGLPLIKLAVISTSEQLDTSTIISSALSTIIGGSIIILFLFFLSQNYKRDSNIKSHLTDLSNAIEKNFLSEIDSAYKQMIDYDSHTFGAVLSGGSYEISKPLLENTVDAKNITIIENNSFKTPRKDYRFSFPARSGFVVKDIFNLPKPTYPAIYPHGDYYFWVDKNGKQKAYFTPFNEFGNLSDLSSRDYVNKKDEWFLPNSNDKKFRLESIVSMSSGSVKAAISKPSSVKEMPVIAISSMLTSIINTILPKDYAFCIIDKEGLVWFHSDENLNLKENFIEECNNDNELKSLLYAGANNTLEVDYYNQQHKIHISPINNIPLYLVTMHNMQAESSFQKQAITLALALLGFLLLMLFIQIVALLIIERKYRLPLNRNFIMKLTRPISRLNSEYIYLYKLYIIVALVMAPFLVISENLAAVAMIFAMVIIIFCYSYYILNQNDLKIKHRKRFGQFNLALLMIVTVVSIILLKDEAWREILIFEGVLAATMLLSHIFIRKEKQDLSGYWNNYTYFYLMVLILFGIIPTLKFYELAYETESEIRVRHLMYDFANQKEKRNLDIHNYFSKINVTDTTRAQIEEIYASRKNSGIYGDMVHGLKFSDQVVIGTTEPERSSQWDNLIKHIRPYYDDYVVENKYLLHENAGNENMAWYLTDEDRRLTFVYPSQTNNFSLEAIEDNAVSAELPELNLYLPFGSGGAQGTHKWLLNMLYWILVGTLIYLIYNLMNFSISQIFTRRIITNFHYQDFSKILHQQKLANKDIMIYRLSRRDHSTTFRDDFIKTYGSLAIDTSSVEKMAKTQLSADSLISKQARLSEKEDREPFTLLIDHFDMGFDKPDFFIQKLEAISKYLKRSDIHLVIFSQLKPEKIQRYYREETEKLAGEGITDNEGYKLQSEKHKNIINQLDELMIALLATPLPVLYHRPLKNIKKYCTEKPRRISDEDLIKGELSASDYLAHYEDALMTYKSDYIDAEKIKEGEDLIITKINTLADKYYLEIFESCTAEEKHALFDMAHDQILNPKNETAINSLLRKGLLVKKCYKINFMNMSFRRFIISKITKPEKLKIENALGKPAGTWQNYRNALLLVIVALFIFIALANQDFLDNLKSLFVALGGIIAVVTSVLRMLSQKGKPVSE